MQALFLCHRLPYPPDKGDKIRSYHLLTFLAKRGAVDCVTHVDDPRDSRHIQILQDMCRSVHVFSLNPLVGRMRALLALAGRTPLSVAYMTRKKAARRVGELLREHRYDLVVGFSSQTAAYFPQNGHVPLLLDMVDVDSEKWSEYADGRGLRAFLPRLEARRLQAFERRIGARTQRVVLTTPREVELYRDRVGVGRPEAIGNGVVLPPRVRPQEERGGHLAIFLGTMDYLPNVEAVELAAKEVLPRVRSAVPDARFRIVGRSPSRRVLALQRIEGVEVTGEVPDPGVHLDDAALALVPLRVARGIQNKVLESLASGLPVVATPAVCACLEGGAEDAVAAASTPDDLAREVVALMRDPALRARRAAAGRLFVERHHDWAQHDAAWARLLQEVLS